MRGSASGTTIATARAAGRRAVARGGRQGGRRGEAALPRRHSARLDARGCKEQVYVAVDSGKCETIIRNCHPSHRGRESNAVITTCLLILPLGYDVGVPRRPPQNHQHPPFSWAREHAKHFFFSFKKPIVSALRRSWCFCAKAILYSDDLHRFKKAPANRRIPELVAVYKHISLVINNSC